MVVIQTVDNALDPKGLGDEQSALLDLIDKVQYAQLDDVKLPQIVVVGDQSAGKSSVLEALSGTQFPRESVACTRFATEIRMRRAPERSLNVSIIPDKNRTFREQEQLRRFGGAVDADSSFEALMRDAIQLIAPKGVPGRFAARDVLVVDKRGPDMPLLTLVDLPGLVSIPNNDQSLDDIKTIEALSDHYMKSSRTIILAVIGGNTDYVLAPILAKSRKFDPSGARTIGVLTKPDLTASVGLEEKFIELVRNNDHHNHFRLGWFVLMNPGPREAGQQWPSAAERRQREGQFFGQGRWGTLPKEMLGSLALKAKLSSQLQKHIGRYVPTLRRQIQAALNGFEGELKALGEGRDTVEEMRCDLIEMFSSSIQLVFPAVDGTYKNPPLKNFFPITIDPQGTPATNLRARASEQNDRFAQRIREQGRKLNFATDLPSNFSMPPPADPERPGTPPPAPAIQVNRAKRDFIATEVDHIIRQNRGTEFPGDPKPRVVFLLFKNFSEKWPTLAQEHKDNLGVVCNEFLSELIDYTWPRRMHEPLRRSFLDGQVGQLMKGAQAELDKLKFDMTLEIPPHDPDYQERYHNWREAFSREGRVPTEAEEVTEKMLIYYDIMAKNFSRNVITQVVERHLLQGLYRVFEAVKVIKMKDETIESIAAENRATRDRRLALKQQKKAAEEARDFCANLAMRKELRMSAQDERDFGDDVSSDEEEEGQTKTPATPRTSTDTATSGQYNTASSGDRTATQSSPTSSRHRSTPYQSSRADIPQDVPQRTSTTARRPDYNPSPQTPSTYASRPSADEDYYTTSSAPRTAPPPPPPRPEKVRTGLQDDQDPRASYDPYAAGNSSSGFPGGFPGSYQQPSGSGVSLNSGDARPDSSSRKGSSMRKMLGVRS